MTIGVAQVVLSDGNTGGTGTTQSVTITVSAGSTNYTGTSNDMSGANPTVTVSDGTSYTQIDGDTTDTGVQKIDSFYRQNVSAATLTVTATFSAAVFATCNATAEITGGKTSGILDVHGPGNVQTLPGTGTDAITSGASQTNTQQPALVIGFTINVDGNATPSAGTGFTSAGTGWSLGTAQNLCRVESKRVISLAGQQATFTTGTNAAHITTMAVFLESGAAGAATFQPGPQRKPPEESAHAERSAVAPNKSVQKLLPVQALLPVDQPGMGVWILPEEPPPEQAIQRRLTIPLPNGTVVASFLPRPLRAVPDSQLNDEAVLRRARRAPESVDQPLLEPHPRPEEAGPAEQLPKLLRRTPESVDQPILEPHARPEEPAFSEPSPALRKRTPESVDQPLLEPHPRPEEPAAAEALPRLRLRAPESVDQPLLEPHPRPEEPASAESLPKLQLRSSESVDAPPVAQRRALNEQTIEERVARRLLAQPSSVDAPPTRQLSTIREDYFDGERVGRPVRFQPPPPAAGDQPPLKTSFRAFEENPFGAEKVPGRLPVPLPTGPAVVYIPVRLLGGVRAELLSEESLPKLLRRTPESVDQPIIERHRRPDPWLPEESLPRLRLQSPESVDVPVLGRRKGVEDQQIDERPGGLKPIAQLIAATPVTFIPVRARALPDEGLPEQIPQRAHGRIESVDQPLLFNPRYRVPEDIDGERVAVRRFLQPPPIPPGDLPLFHRHRLPEEPAFPEIVVRVYPGIPVSGPVVVATKPPFGTFIGAKQPATPFGRFQS